MIKLKDYVKDEYEYKNMRYPEDVKRIVEVMKNKDIEITPEEAEWLWNVYSDDYCAQWLCLSDDDEDIFNIIIEYAKKLYGDKEEF